MSLRAWLRQLQLRWSPQRRSRRPASTPVRHTARPGVEWLEDRINPASLPTPTQVIQVGPSVYGTAPNGEIGLIQAIIEADSIRGDPTSATSAANGAVLELTPGYNYVLTNALNPQTIGQGASAFGSPSSFSLSPSLTEENWYGPNGLPVIDNNIVIVGNGATIERSSNTSNNFRLLYVSGGAEIPGTAQGGGPELPAGQLTVSNLTLANGLAQGGNGGSGGGGGLGAGGAIFNQGILDISGVTFMNDSAVGGNGGSGANGDDGGGGGMGSNGSNGTGGFFGTGSGGTGGGFGGDFLYNTSVTFGGNGGLGNGKGGSGGGGFLLGSNGATAGPGAGGGKGALGGAGGGGLSGNGAAGGDGGGGGAYASGSGGGGAGGNFGYGGGGGFIYWTSNGSGSIKIYDGGGGGGGGVGGGGGGSGGSDPKGSAGAGGGGFGGGGGAFLGEGGFGGGGGAGASSNFGGGNGGNGGGGGAGLGGAIFNMGDYTYNSSGTTPIADGVLNITDSTFTADSATGGNGGAGGTGVGSVSGSGGQGDGGAIFNLDGNLTLVNDTLAFNSATGGAPGSGKGGITGAASGTDVYNLAAGNFINNGVPLDSAPPPGTTYGGYLYLYNDILAEPATATSDLYSGSNFTDVTAAYVYGSTNLIQSYSNNGLTDLGPNVITSAVNPNLLPLADNGGPTETIGFTTSSAAYGAGSTSVPGLPSTDQRGFPRVVDGQVDLGAFEVQVPYMGVATVSVNYDPSPQVVTLSTSVLAPDGTPINQGQVTFFAAGEGITVPVSNGSASAQIALPGGLPPGSYPIVASFTDNSGDWRSGSSVGILQLLAGPTTITVTSITDTYTWNAQVETVTGTVTTNGQPVPEGTVIVSDGGQTQTVGVNGGGFRAVFNFPLFGEFPQSHGIGVTYGDPGGLYGGSSNGGTAPNTTIEWFYQFLLDALILQTYFGI
jgi:hypothetical protein